MRGPEAGPPGPTSRPWHAPGPPGSGPPGGPWKRALSHRPDCPVMSRTAFFLPSPNLTTLDAENIIGYSSRLVAARHKLFLYYILHNTKQTGKCSFWACPCHFESNCNCLSRLWPPCKLNTNCSSHCVALWQYYRFQCS